METAPQLNKQLMKQVTKIFKLLSDPTRINILHVLKDRELNVNTIAQTIDMEQSAVSHQLRVLKEANLVTSRQSGRNVLYCHADDHVYTILNQVIAHAKERKADQKNERI